MIRLFLWSAGIAAVSSIATAQAVFDSYNNQFPGYIEIPNNAQPPNIDLPTSPSYRPGGGFDVPGSDEPLRLGSPSEFCTKFPQYPLCQGRDVNGVLK